MIYGLNKNNERILASPNINGKCPICNDIIISRCGNINIWHFAHKNLIECDSFSEGETKWHLDWKENVEEKYREFIIKNHRADIFINNLVIELQNSPIKPEQIIERELFYKNMIWLINGNEFVNNFNIYNNRKCIICKNIFLNCRCATYKDKLINFDKKYPLLSYSTFRWKHPRKTLWYIKKPFFIDFGEFIFEIKKIYNNLPCRGWGYIISYEEFIKRYLNE